MNHGLAFNYLSNHNWVYGNLATFMNLDIFVKS